MSQISTFNPTLISLRFGSRTVALNAANSNSRPAVSPSPVPLKRSPLHPLSWPLTLVPAPQWRPPPPQPCPLVPAQAQHQFLCGVPPLYPHFLTHCVALAHPACSALLPILWATVSPPPTARATAPLLTSVGWIAARTSLPWPVSCPQAGAPSLPSPCPQWVAHSASHPPSPPKDTAPHRWASVP